MNDYQEFLDSKHVKFIPTGFDIEDKDINPKLFKFQRDIVRWACRLGKSALFEECGLGKTAQQLEWARHVHLNTGGKVIILAPLAVAQQTQREGKKFGIEVVYCKEHADIGDSPLIVTNYQRLHKFDASVFTGVVLDESSILKSFTGKTKRALDEAFEHTPYKLCATATPAPNDYMEILNHAQFLGIMRSNEALSRWFINDTMSAGSYRLKKHAEIEFWRWLTEWAVCVSVPSDLGDEYHMDGFELPPLEFHEHSVEISSETWERAFEQGRLFPDPNPTATGLHKVKRESLENRVKQVQEIVDNIPQDESIIIWCDLNDESAALHKAIPSSVEIKGAHSLKIKEDRLMAFTDGSERILITKADIAGWGMNWQHCHHQIFAGVNYSFEKFYQAIRRSYRFGQAQQVDVHVVYAPSEENVVSKVKSKQKDFNKMQKAMNEAMTVHGLFRNFDRRVLVDTERDVAEGKNWTAYLGDSCVVMQELEADSVHLSVHSPPFSNLYIYSDSEADMGNCENDEEFFKHYEFIIEQLYRITLPGRLAVVHCKDLPAYMNRDGAAGLRDFPGEIIRRFESHGWQYHSRVTIWKDPVIEMQRTKNHGLLHKNFSQRSEATRQGMPDYLIVFRKWDIEGGTEIKQKRVIGDYIGANPPSESDIHPNKRSREDNYSIALWQRYASPVWNDVGDYADLGSVYADPIWFDINQTDVLNYRVAKGNEDEKHIAPLQLDLIARCVDLWSAKGETVFTPFMGIGSECYEAIKMGRKAVGIELKRNYFDYAVKYLKEVEASQAQPTLLELIEDGASDE